MTQHTPGPWTAYQSQNEQGAPIPRWRIHGPDLCGPFVTIDIDITTETCAKQDANLKANAALIAAAPELLEACQCLLRDGDMPEIIELMEQAVAKAEGRG